MNQKTATLIRKFGKSIGVDPKLQKSQYRALKRAHTVSNCMQKAASTKMMREAVVAQ